MKLHSIKLRNFRGVRELVLSDLPETGVVVVHGRLGGSVGQAGGLDDRQPIDVGADQDRASFAVGQDAHHPAADVLNLVAEGPEPLGDLSRGLGL